MSKIFALSIAAMTLFSASHSFANPVLTGEVVFGDTRSNRLDSTEYRVNLTNKFDFLNVGAELQTKQNLRSTNIDSTLSLNVGVDGLEFLGVSTALYGEVGEFASRQNNETFYGLGVNASRQVYGSLSANVGYRLREGFDSQRFVDEDRLNVGASYQFLTNTGVGVNYYRTRGTTNSETVGLSLVRKF